MIAHSDRWVLFLRWFARFLFLEGRSRFLPSSAVFCHPAAKQDALAVLDHCRVAAQVHQTLLPE